MQATETGLTDFQQRTVEYVFSRMYGSNAVSRFLIADEVGLGKTIVARGLIAKIREHLQGSHFDIIYICNNASIASQNSKRLGEGFSVATRLTLLPEKIAKLTSNRVNFLSLTPATSFTNERNRGGVVRERATIYALLLNLPLEDSARQGLSHLLQEPAGSKQWEKIRDALCKKNIDQTIAQAFCSAIVDDKPSIRIFCLDVSVLLKKRQRIL